MILNKKLIKGKIISIEKLVIILTKFLNFRAKLDNSDQYLYYFVEKKLSFL